MLVEGYHAIINYYKNGLGSPGDLADYGVRLKERINSSMITMSKIVTEEFIDYNQHVSETAYYNIAIRSLQELHEKIGLNSLFWEYNVAPIVFNSRIDFVQEMFKDEEMKIKVEFLAKSKDFRKWDRTFEILNGSEKTAAIVESEGAFFDLKKRKVCSPPTEIIRAFNDVGLLESNRE